jgi:adenylate cyclase
VIANTRHMMGLLAENASKEPLEQRVALMDEAEFRETLRVFTRRVAELLDAERASLFLVDQDRGEMTLCVSQDLAAGETVRIPIGSGIAGAAAASGRPVRVADAYEDPRFNRNVDVKTGFRTRSVLCLPLHDSSGNVFAVTQLLNRRDGRPFDEDDEARYADFAGPLGVLLESLVAMGGVETA